MTRALLLAALAALCFGQVAAAQTGTILRKPDNSTAYQAMDQATGTDIKNLLARPALVASGVSVVTGALASNTLTSTFTPTAGRMFYATISGTGSSTVTVIYSRDAGASWAAEATGVDGSAPIVTNKIAYAGVPIRVPLVVTETGVLVALCPGSMTSGTACSGTVTGTVSYAFSQ